MIKAPKLRFKEFSEDWEEDELGNIIEISKSKYNPLKNEEDYKCIELENLSQETGQLLGYFNSKEQQSIKNKFNKDEVLFGKLRPYLKKYWLADFEGVCSSEIWVLNGIKASNNFIYRLIQTDKFNFISNISSGSKMPRADWSYMREFPFFIPKLEEQEKIASFFSLIEEKISLQGEKLELLKDYKSGMMQKIFSRELRFKDDEGRDYPEWEEKKLGNLIYEPTKVKEEEPEKQELLTVKLHCLGIEATGKRPNSTKNGRPYYKRFKGELLIGRQNMHNGGMGIVDDKCNGLIASNAISSYISKEDVSIDFIYYTISRADYYKRIDLLIGGTGQKEISKKELENLVINIPCLEEQIKIVEFLNKVDIKLEKEQEKLDSLNEYKKGLLQQMFV